MKGVDQCQAANRLDNQQVLARRSSSLAVALRKRTRAFEVGGASLYEGRVLALASSIRPRKAELTD